MKLGGVSVWVNRPTRGRSRRVEQTGVRGERNEDLDREIASLRDTVEHELDVAYDSYAWLTPAAGVRRARWRRSEARPREPLEPRRRLLSWLKALALYGGLIVLAVVLGILAVYLLS
jgi:hypothetical protein